MSAGTGATAERSGRSPHERAAVLAEVVRGGLVESVHLGHLVVLGPDGGVVAALGDPSVTIYPRSSLKPLQAVAMLREGLELDGARLALAASSHSGEAVHQRTALAVLAGAGLSEGALRNTPDLPIGDEARRAWIAAGRGPSRLAANCSGKHAAMLATCVAGGHDTATYLDPAHPLQRTVAATVAELAGAAGDPTADGCGAPLFSCTLAGLARAFADIATAGRDTPEGRVAAAVREHPLELGGTGRDVTALVAGVPGLVAKDGAEGVYAAALPDGSAVAVKVLDGSSRPRAALVAAGLRVLGVDAPVLDAVSELPVLGGGHPVGRVRIAPLV